MRAEAKSRDGDRMVGGYSALEGGCGGSLSTLALSLARWRAQPHTVYRGVGPQKMLSG